MHIEKYNYCLKISFTKDLNQRKLDVCYYSKLEIVFGVFFCISFEKIVLRRYTKNFRINNEKNFSTLKLLLRFKLLLLQLKINHRSYYPAFPIYIQCMYILLT